MTLGERIYRMRTEKKMSQGDLADTLDISRQSVSKWENNTAVPELDKLVKLAQLFDITLDELVTGKTEKPLSPPTPTTDAAPRKSLSVQQITGLVLLAIGVLCLIVFSAVGFMIGSLLMGFFIAVPFLLCGCIFFVEKHNIGLLCGHAVYLPIWLLGNVLIMRTKGIGVLLLSAGLFGAGIALTIIACRRMKTGRLSVNGFKKVLWLLAMVISLLITLAVALRAF